MSTVLTRPVMVTWSADRDAAHSPGSDRWHPDNFARMQIRGLVRQVFFSHAERSVRQVVIGAVDADGDVRGICRRIGEVLALETPHSVAVVGGVGQGRLAVGTAYDGVSGSNSKPRDTPLKQVSTRIRENLWSVPAMDGGAEQVSAESLHLYLSSVRKEFAFSILEAPPAAESQDATAMAQFADGIVLVLSARHTRRETARRIKESLVAAQVRLLGTVLSDRTFPMPEAIYRRL